MSAKNAIRLALLGRHVEAGLVHLAPLQEGLVLLLLPRVVVAGLLGDGEEGGRSRSGGGWVGRRNQGSGWVGSDVSRWREETGQRIIERFVVERSRRDGWPSMSCQREAVEVGCWGSGMVVEVRDGSTERATHVNTAMMDHWQGRRRHDVVHVRQTVERIGWEPRWRGDTHGGQVTDRRQERHGWHLWTKSSAAKARWELVLKSHVGGGRELNVPFQTEGHARQLHGRQAIGHRDGSQNLILDVGKEGVDLKTRTAQPSRAAAGLGLLQVVDGRSTSLCRRLELSRRRVQLLGRTL